MIVTPVRFLRFPSLHLWWPERSADVFPYLENYSVVSVMQCSDSVASELREHSFRNRAFFTSILDLSLAEEELWSGLSRKSCRYEINRARKEAPSVRFNERQGEALRLLNDFIARTRYRKIVSDAEWRDLMATCDVSVVESGNQVVAAHVLLRDARLRARLLYSATVERSDPLQRSVVGALNRYLHWWEILHYREEGVRHYDFGGVDLRTASPLYTISRFKLSFGGPVVRENIVRLAGNSAMRSILRVASKVRGAWKRFGN